MNNYLFRFIILPLSFLSLLFFIYGFIELVEMGHPVLYALLTGALLLKILKAVFEWYHYAGVKEVPKPPLNTQYKVDMLTTACPGEPLEMIENTVKAMVKVQYPHETYLCDEGNDPYLKNLCGNLGVHYVTRTTKEDAKAGNINNALKNATGDLCVILDPDHEPFPNFLDEVLPYFEDPEVGYVQVVQAYKNQPESLVARAAAEQTYFFYGPLMRGMGTYGTAQAIGANCTFRRKALDSIGGHASGLTEDMHTSMLLHANKWKSAYVPKIVSKGLVPNDLSAFYKQQLKWSRGTFDLWINKYPVLFRKFTWQQKLHYFVLPFFFFFGFVTLINITVPIYALFTGEYPWLMDPVVFFVYFCPFLFFGIINRIFAYKWLNEPKERGLHIFGGVLNVGTWWVYIIGFIYTLINIKVPYIPTPKNYNPKNEFLLASPNLIISGICIVASIYGLYMDWQPYSILMAGFAMFNAFILLLAFFIGQTRWITPLKNSYKKAKRIYSINLTYYRLNRIATYFVVTLPILYLSFTLTSIMFKKHTDREIMNLASPGKAYSGFFTGIYLPDTNEGINVNNFKQIEDRSDHKFSIISTYLAWGPDPLPVEDWKKITEHGAIPMVTWEPWTNLFDDIEHKKINNNKKVFHHIVQGSFDEYIDNMAFALQSLKSPVFLRFAHEMDNTMYPWSETGGNTPEEFVLAWKYIHNRFTELRVHNVIWVWNPLHAHNMDVYFPYGNDKSSTQYVDWIGLTTLNYGSANENQKWSTFDEIYKPFKDKIKEHSLNHPIMLAEFGSTSYGGSSRNWVTTTLSELNKNYPEIRSMVLFYSSLDKNWFTNWRPEFDSSYINWTFDIAAISDVLTSLKAIRIKSLKEENPENTPSYNLSVTGNYGNFQWVVKGAPYYMKGVGYDPNGNFRDGFYPLTRKQLENDFQLIKDMGANTIRRYSPGFYDRNILNVAEEKELNILYGFDFNPQIDFYLDASTLEKYEKNVLSYVKDHKKRDCIIAWNIGNETYTMQKRYFTEPHLTLTRTAYLEFLENLAQKIHAIDPDRPVFSSEGHEQNELPYLILEFRNHAPSIDIIGINSYYEQNIGSLKSIFETYDTLRPYVITEFGPKGYWDKQFGDYNYDTVLIEPSSIDKARWYEQQWNKYIEANKGYNLGGSAYTWRDRFKGTATWFGITDSKGRLRPSYFHLKHAWTGAKIRGVFPDMHVVGHWYPLNPGESIWLSAANLNNYKGELKYEWRLYSDTNWKQENSIIEYDNYVQVFMPKDKGKYRIYLYATDSLNNVVTASRSLIYK